MSDLPLVDLTKHPHPALCEYPILSSDRSGWRGVFFNHYHHPAHESPEFQYTQHIIGIIGNGHPIHSEHRSGLIIFGSFWLFPWGNATENIALSEGLEAFKNPIYLFDAKGVLIGSLIQVSLLFVIIAISTLKPWGRINLKSKN